MAGETGPARIAAKGSSRLHGAASVDSEDRSVAAVPTAARWHTVLLLALGEAHHEEALEQRESPSLGPYPLRTRSAKYHWCPSGSSAEYPRSAQCSLP